jgi:hypothetical protein
MWIRIWIRNTAKKDMSTNRKSAKCHFCRRSADPTNYLNLQSCNLKNLFADSRPLQELTNTFRQTSSCETVPLTV